MGKILAWVKAHLIPVICIAIVVVSLPVAYVFSSNMAKGVKEELQAKVKTEFQKVERQNVSYQLPSFASDMEEVSLSHPPNDAITKWFADHASALEQEAGQVSQAALAFNKRDHQVLVSGMFPEPTNADDRRLKPFEFLRALSGYRGAESVVDRLLGRVNGGSPPDSARVAIGIEEEKTRFIADLERKRGPGQNMSDDEQEAMTAHLREARIDQYRRQAGRLSVYISPEVLLAALEVPETEPANPPAAANLFEKQWNVWIVTDILDAIALANSDERGRPQRIVPVSKGSLGSVVKRVNSIEARLGGDNYLGYLVYEGEQTTKDRGGQGSPGGLVGTADSWSLTGRLTHTDNQVYDVIDVSMQLIVDVERLPKLLQAFEEINFMSVLDVDLKEVDPWNDLQEGYVYGSGSIAKATIVLETVWLREWTIPLMPTAFREGIGAKGFENNDN